MADKWAQRLGQLADEFRKEQRRRNGKVNKGRWLKKAVRVAKVMTEELERDVAKKRERLSQLERAESAASFAYGDDSFAYGGDSFACDSFAYGDASFAYGDCDYSDDPGIETGNEASGMNGTKDAKKANGTEKAQQKKDAEMVIPKPDGESGTDGSKKQQKEGSKRQSVENDGDDKVAEEWQKAVAKAPGKNYEYLFHKKLAELDGKIMEDDAEIHKVAIAMAKAELEASIKEEEVQIAKLSRRQRIRAEARKCLEACEEHDQEEDVAAEAQLVGDATINSNSNSYSNRDSYTLSFSGTESFLNDDSFAEVSYHGEYAKNYNRNFAANAVSDRKMAPLTLETNPPATNNRYTADAPPLPQQPSFYTVEVPAGIHPGMPFLVEAYGQRIEVTCPPNVEPGQEVRIPVPAAATPEPPQRPYHAPNEQGSYDVIVPEGVAPGKPFKTSVGGRNVIIHCPANAVPGQRIRINPAPESPTIQRGANNKDLHRPPSTAGPSTGDAPAAMLHRNITIPPNVFPGMPFDVEVNGGRVRLTCPQDTQPGQTIRMSFPAAPPQVERDRKSVV